MTASSITSPLGLPRQGTPDELAEDALVRRAQGGCPEAFRALVERHQQPVYRFCHCYLRDAEDALEASQDTFVRAHGALSRFTPRAKFSTWLFRIALNLCRDRARARKGRRDARSGIDDHQWACRGVQPDEAAMRDGDLAKLDRGLNALPAALRAVVVLSCLDGLSHAECAGILKCSERAIEGRLYRARQRLAAWWDADPS